MKNIILGVSLITLSVCNPGGDILAAEEMRSTTTVTQPETTAERMWRPVEEGIDDIQDMSQELFNGNNTSTINSNIVVIDPRQTAQGIIEKPVYNDRGQRVAEVDDIIINTDGRAMYVIISNDTLLNIGERQVAYDYNAVTRASVNDGVMMPITEASFENATPFTYDRADQSDPTRVAMPVGGISVARLLGSRIIDANGFIIGSLENIILDEDQASHAIVTMNDQNAFGNRNLAIDMNDLSIVANGNNYELQLNQTEAAAQFETYRAVLD